MIWVPGMDDDNKSSHDQIWERFKRQERSVGEYYEEENGDENDTTNDTERDTD